MKTNITQLLAILAIAFLINVSTFASKTNASVMKVTSDMVASGNVLNFDGYDDFIDVGNAPSVQLSQGTIEAWIKTGDAGSSYRGIVVKQWAYGLFLRDNELIGFGWDGNGEIPTDVILNDDAWHHVAMSFNFDVEYGSKIYIDGVLVKTFTYYLNNQDSNLGIACGNVNGTSSYQNFNGLIDEVRVWNTVRTASEIQATMNSELVGNESGLVTYYNFNQGVAGGNNTAITTATDLATNNNGLLNNFAKTGSTSNFVVGKTLTLPVNDALNFDGVNDYGVINSSFGNPNTLTIEFWFKTSTTTYSALFGQSGGVPTAVQDSWVPTILILANGKIQAELWANGIGYITSPLSYNDNQWHHIAFVGAGNNQILYIDGVLIGSRAGAIDNSWWSNTTIGAGYSDSDRGASGDDWYYFNGAMDDVRIWNTARSITEIQNNLGAELVGNETGLLAYYKTNEGSGTTLVDNKTGGTNSGTLTNSPTWIPVERMATLAATTSASSITAATATSGGNVIYNGGVTVTARGVCWSTSPNPTITDSKTSDGIGTGTFSSSITGLTASTTYYVRAYATNSKGTN